MSAQGTCEVKTSRINSPAFCLTLCNVQLRARLSRSQCALDALRRDHNTIESMQAHTAADLARSVDRLQVRAQCEHAALSLFFLFLLHHFIH